MGVFAKAALYSMAVLDAAGQPMAGTLVSVRTEGGAVATLWRDGARSAVAPNPLPVDIRGDLVFYALPGRYLVDVPGRASQAVMVFPDPDELDVGRWHVRIDAEMPISAWSGYSVFYQNSAQLYQSYLSATAQGAYVRWKVALAAGTWTVALMSAGYSDRGILSIRVNGTERARADCYSASATYPRTVATGVPVDRSGLAFVEVNSVDKNVSSSGYAALLYSINLTRTA